jgi:hypothetical protein
MSADMLRFSYFIPLFFLATVAFWSSAAFAQVAQQQIQITASVSKSCTINGTTSGTPDTATIRINASNNVVVGTITPPGSPYSNVICNAPATIQLSSQQGAAKNSATPPTGYANTIDYAATATWNGVTASIDTATTPGATGTETGTAQPVLAGSGSLAVAINPEANTLPLEGGTYSDVLTISLTPQ